jgi:hypothetical protein
MFKRKTASVQLSFLKQPYQVPCTKSHPATAAVLRVVFFFSFVCVFVVRPHRFSLTPTRVPHPSLVSAGPRSRGSRGARVRRWARQRRSGPLGRLLPGQHGHAGHAGLRLRHSLRVWYLLPVYCQRRAGRAGVTKIGGSKSYFILRSVMSS